MIFWLLDNLDLKLDDRVYGASCHVPALSCAVQFLTSSSQHLPSPVAVNEHIDQEFAICPRLLAEYSSRPWKIHFVPLNFQVPNCGAACLKPVSLLTFARE